MKLIFSCQSSGNIKVSFWKFILLSLGEYYFLIPAKRRLPGNVFLFFEVNMWDFERRYGYFLLESYFPNLNKTDEFSGYLFPSVKCTNLY
jgi:hypothetical protein